MIAGFRGFRCLNAKYLTPLPRGSSQFVWLHCCFLLWTTTIRVHTNIEKGEKSKGKREIWGIRQLMRRKDGKRDHVTSPR